jgi:hypothetical protein
MIFDYVRVLFYADDMKIQSDLNKLSEWCEFHHVEFSYMLGGTVLDRVSSKRSGGHHRREDEYFEAYILRSWDLSEDCHSSSEIRTL